MTETVVCHCALCGDERLRGEPCYEIEGMRICPACLERFAQRYFQASLVLL